MATPRWWSSSAAEPTPTPLFWQVRTIAGFATRLITIRFDDLSEDPERDPLWVSIRNPKLMPPGELQARRVELDENGNPANADAAMHATHEMIAKLVVAWRMYDATSNEINMQTGEPLDQQLLPLPATPESCAKLPMEVVRRISEEMTSAVSPPT